jgi:hypothetical protein
MPILHAVLSPRAVMALVLCLTGCFTADATLNADGSGTIDLEYIPGQEHATIESETARFTSPHVTVRELVPREVGAFLRASFDDVTKLSTAEGFSTVSVRRDRKRGEERLRIVIRNLTPKELTEEKHAGPRVSITLPGRVRAANDGAEIEDRRVTWRVPLLEYARRPLLVLSVRYAAS